MQDGKRPECRKCGSPNIAPSRVKKQDYICNSHLTEAAVARKQPSRQYQNRKLKPGYKSGMKIRQRRWHLQKMYGLTEAQFTAMFQAQGGRCAICPSPAEAVDHDHQTNTIRALLCKACNSALGLFKENISTLQNAVTYLEKYNARRSL